MSAAQAEDLGRAAVRSLSSGVATMRDLDRLALAMPETKKEVSELRDLVIDAWLTRAPKRVAKAWLAEHEPD